MASVNVSLGRRITYVVVSFLLGVAATISVPKLVGGAAERIFPIGLEEIARVTSPDGVIDAVMIRDNCGVPCPFGYSVFLVPKGRNAPKDFAQPVFRADSMVDEKLTWKTDHILEIAYSKAEIYAFRNISYPLGDFGAKEGNWQYRVEVCLKPAPGSALR
jgi:hypothetical protein